MSLGIRALIVSLLFAVSSWLVGCSSGDSSTLDGGGDATSQNDSGSQPDTSTADAGTDSAADAGADAGFTVLRSFDGDFGAAVAGRGKPEMNVASNGTQVAQVTSQNLVVFDTTGKQLASTSMTALVTSAGLNPASTAGAPYEPHIVFDEFIQRWVVSVTCLYDCVLVSSGADPVTSTWAGFYLNNNGNDPSLHLAYDKNGVYVTEVVIANPNPDTGTCCSTIVFAIPGVEMQWTTTLAPAHKNKTIGKPLETMAIIDHDPSKAAGAPAFFLAKTCAGTNCQATPAPNLAFQWVVSYGTWSGTTFTMTSNHTSLCAGGASPADQCVRANTDGLSDLWVYNIPLDPNQPNTTNKLRGAEIHRIIDGMELGSHVHVVIGSGPCTSACGAHGTDLGGDIFIWADIDCSTLGSCKVGQTQKVSTTQQLLWPTLGVDPYGNVGIFANVVDATSTYLGIEAWTHAATAAPGALSGPTITMPGTTTYTCSLGSNNTSQSGNPVGIATVRDPLDPTALWVTEQYAANTGDCHWMTRIFEYRP